MNPDSKKVSKERLDVMVYERGLANSREEAKKYIMSGVVFVNNQKEDKAGQKFPADANIEVRQKKMKYVSRGGYKLEKGIEVFGIDPGDKVCMDIGSSTGGFTDCMLQNGAKKVYAIDVGTNQLAWSLRNDERVISMEKTNIRYVKPEDIGEKADLFSVDVSFISLGKILHVVYTLLNDDATGLCLIKPQFEAGRENVGKKGVVRDKKIHIQVIKDVLDFTVESGFFVKGLTYSPIRGPEGNIEYLMYVKKIDEEQMISTKISDDKEQEISAKTSKDEEQVISSETLIGEDIDIEKVVNDAWEGALAHVQI